MHPGLWSAFGDAFGADFRRSEADVRHAGSSSGGGRALTLRFGVLVHDGDADLTAAFQDFLTSPDDCP